MQQEEVLSLGLIERIDSAMIAHPILVTDDPSVPFYASPEVPCPKRIGGQLRKWTFNSLTEAVAKRDVIFGLVAAE